MKIGFVGQGWIGKNYADDFERRGYDIVRYALEEPYIQNKDSIAECDIIFVAVPTPTTPDGFDDSVVRAAIKVVKKGATVIIKSTILPGTTRSIQKEYPDLFIMHSPEFLTEATAVHDAANPDRNIIGIIEDTQELRKRAEEVLSVLPEAPYKLICKAEEAELIKYGGNCWFYFKVIFINMLFDLANKLDGVDYEIVRDALSADPRIGSTHLQPIHHSGRGAGGHCFIKDFEAFRRIYHEKVKDQLGDEVMESLVNKNKQLLVDSNKDIDILESVHGKTI